MSTDKAKGGSEDFTGESYPQISQITQIPGRGQPRVNTDKHAPETKEALGLTRVVAALRFAHPEFESEPGKSVGIGGISG